MAVTVFKLFKKFNAPNSKIKIARDNQVLYDGDMRYLDLINKWYYYQPVRMATFDYEELKLFIEI